MEGGIPWERGLLLLPLLMYHHRSRAPQHSENISPKFMKRSGSLTAHPFSRAPSVSPSPLSPNVNKLNIWAINKKETDVNLPTSFLPPQWQIPGFFAHPCHLICFLKTDETSSCLLGEGARSKASSWSSKGFVYSMQGQRWTCPITEIRDRMPLLGVSFSYVSCAVEVWVSDA